MLCYRCCVYEKSFTGDKNFYGEYLINAKEDVVAGIRTPQNITLKSEKESGSNEPSMEEAMPKVYQQLVKIYKSWKTLQRYARY